MRHKIAGRKLSRSTAARTAMLRTAVTDLLRHERLQTTDAKAREIRRMTEKLITRGKRGSVHDRRQAASVLTDKRVVQKLFDELAPRYEDRMGGYTRMTKLGNRQGDAAPMAIVELVSQ